MPSAKLGNFTIHFINSEEYHHLKQEVFTHHAYYIELEKSDPVIIDLGAHIGLATLYYKQLYPDAQIIAVEPLPENLTLLHQNVNDNGLSGVTIIPKAISDTSDQTTLYFDSSGESWWSTAGFIKGAWTQTQSSDSVVVKTTTLTELLTSLQHVDILKVDIEGAEHLAFAKTPSALLKKISHCFIEFHPVKDKTLKRLVDVLSQGFREVIVLTATGDTISPKQYDSYKHTGLLLIQAHNQ